MILFIVSLINAIPDPVRFAIMPVLKLVALFLGLPLYEDGTLDI